MIYVYFDRKRSTPDHKLHLGDEFDVNGEAHLVDKLLVFPEDENDLMPELPVIQQKFPRAPRTYTGMCLFGDAAAEVMGNWRDMAAITE